MNEREESVFPKNEYFKIKGNIKKPTPENYIKDIRRKTKRLFTAEQKVLIVMEALRAEISVAELCRNTRSTNLSFTNGSDRFL